MYCGASQPATASVTEPPRRASNDLLPLPSPTVAIWSWPDWNCRRSLVLPSNVLVIIGAHGRSVYNSTINEYGTQDGHKPFRWCGIGRLRYGHRSQLPGWTTN